MPLLYDARGTPVDLAALKRPPAPRPPNVTPRTFNPDPTAVVQAFRKADQGDPRDLHELAREVRRRDGHFGGQLRNRTRAVTRLPFKVEALTDDRDAVDIADAVKADILDAPFFRPLLSGLLDASLRGYSVCSLTWETGASLWRPVAARLEDPRDTIVDTADGVTVRWRNPADPTKAIDIPPFTAVIHASGDTDGPLWGRGLQFALAIYYSLKRGGVAAWAAFVEFYGVARPVATYPASWEQDQIDDLDARLGSWGHAGRLVLPNGASVTFPAPSQNASEASHEGLARFCNSEASKAILGQTMTSDSGSSRAQAEVHERVADWILEADSLDVCATIEAQIVRPYVLLNYGPDAPVPKVRPQIEDKALRAFRLEVLKELVPHGLEVEQSVARDLGAFPEPAEGAKVLRAASSPATPSAPPAPGAEADVEGLRRLVDIAREFKSASRLAEDQGDIIDRDGAAAAASWRDTMGAFVDGAKAAAAEASGYDNFLERLRGRKVDGDAFAKSLATWAMKARGLGDGTDET